MGMFIILITYVVIALPSTRGLHAIEGEEVELLFPYPCESTLISLQLGNRAPFYTSPNPGSTQLPPNYVVANRNNYTRGDNCTLRLTINPVSRKDEGTFILISYKDGDIKPQLIRIWLEIGYLPGKASCESRNILLNGEWVSLHCTASVERHTGQIKCYQGGIRMVALTALEENDETLNQNFLARVLEDLVYCCSSTFEHTKDRCECKDWGWNPLLNISIIHTDPCLGTLSSDSTPSHKSSHPLRNSHIYSSSGSLIPTNTTKDLLTVNDKNTGSSSIGIYIVIGIFPLVVLILVTVIVMIVRKKKILQRTKCLSSDTRKSTKPGSIAHNYSQGQTETEYRWANFDVTDRPTSYQSPFDVHFSQNMEFQPSKFFY